MAVREKENLYRIFYAVLSTDQIKIFLHIYFSLLEIDELHNPLNLMKINYSLNSNLFYLYIIDER